MTGKSVWFIFFSAQFLKIFSKENLKLRKHADRFHCNKEVKIIINGCLLSAFFIDYRYSHNSIVLQQFQYAIAMALCQEAPELQVEPEETNASDDTGGRGTWKHTAFHVATTIATPAAYAPLPFALASLGWFLGKFNQITVVFM